MRPARSRIPTPAAPSDSRLRTRTSLSADGAGGCHGPLLHLLGRDVLDVRGDPPRVSVRVHDLSRTISVELVLNVPREPSARRHGLLGNRVHVLEIEQG